MAIRHWDAESTYSEGSTVIYGGTIYISRGDMNKGHVPTSQVETRVWWAKVEGGSQPEGSDAYTDIIGDGVSRTYNIQHDLGNSDVFVQMRYNDSTRQFTDARIFVLDDNNIRIDTYEPLPVDSVVVFIASVKKDKDGTISTVIGDGVSTVFEIEHGFASYNFFASIRDVASGMFVRAKVKAETPFKAVIEFTSPPPENGVQVILMHILSSGNTGDRYIHTQDTESDVWVIRHNMAKFVAVQVFDEDGVELAGVITQDYGSLCVVKVEFNHPHKGFAVVI